MSAALSLFGAGETWQFSANKKYCVYSASLLAAVAAITSLLVLISIDPLVREVFKVRLGFICQAADALTSSSGGFGLQRTHLRWIS